ncbi:MAG: metallophosphoesterase family protein, partial [Bryobacteraceae bacterium]
MPYLIVSDIHGNSEGLAAVLADAQGQYDRIFCLGDLVGYGADPNPVAEWARAETAATVRGNHDRACVGSDPLEGFNPSARLSAIWTRGVLTSQNREYLERLPRGPLRIVDGGATGGFDLAHGSPLDEDDYLIAPADLQFMRPYLETQLTFFGHTHVQGGFRLGRTGVRRLDPGSVIELEPDYFYLVNPGSVGQPRDGDPRAAYALYSPEEHAIEFRRAVYDVPKAASKILGAG